MPRDEHSRSHLRRLNGTKFTKCSLGMLALLFGVMYSVLAESEPKHSSARLVVRPGRHEQRLTSSSHDAPAAAVVFQSLDASMSRDLCARNNSDWRGSLPRFLANRLPRTSVIIWDSLATLSGKELDCRLCPRAAPPASYDDAQERFSCREWFARQARRSQLPTAVVVMGSMDRTKKQCLKRCGDECVESALPDGVPFPALHMALQQPWAKSASRRIHFPISNNKEVVAGRIVHFDTVVEDKSYLKPSEQFHQSQLHGKHYACAETTEREPLLLYIARLTRGKGQEQFLQAVSPAELRGATVAFYAGKHTEEAAKMSARLYSIAEQRNISIEVHLDRVDRGELQQRACRASGMILFAKRDRNPRVLYEALYYGLPIFFSSSSNAPRQLTGQSFATTSPYFDPSDLHHDQGSSPAEFSKQFAKFMALTRRRAGVVNTIHSFIDKEMSPNRVYGKICIRIGLCGRNT